MPKGIYKRSKKTLERIKKQGFQKRQSPWNKGIKTGIIPKTAFKKGHKSSPETIKKISIANKGRRVSIETRRKISNSKTGQKRANISGKNHYNWKDGKFTNVRGYILILKPNHPFAYKNYIFEHRFLIEKQIGRYLLPEETAHHINGIKDDNRIENLMLFTSNSAHQRFHLNSNNVKPSEIIFDGHHL